MSLMRNFFVTCAFVVLIGCGGGSKLPKPRPPEPEIPDPAPTATAQGGPASVDVEPGAGSAEVASAATGDAEGSTGPLAFAPADPAALQLQIPAVERGKPLTPAECRRLSIDRMRKITAAIAAYTAEHGHLPPVATYDDEKCPMLSWRVLLLPYLGHKDLFARFKLQEPFNTPNNSRLLASIPPVYQCPDRPDDKTNYLAPVGNNTVFRLGQLEGTPIESVKDGLDSTVVLVEVDHSMAVYWSRPIEYTVYPQDPRRGLITLRDDGFFLGWGNGTVGCWPRTAPANRFAGLFSIDGNEQGLRAISVAAVAGEDNTLASTSSESITEEDQGTVTANYGTIVSDPTGSLTSGSGSTAVPPAIATENQPVAARSAASEARHPVPPDDARSRFLAALRETYSEIASDKSPDKKQQRALAQRLLADAGKSGAEPAEKYVLLDVACKLAVQAGDIDTAGKSLEQLGAGFEIDILPRQVAMLETTSRMSLEQADNKIALSTAQRLITEALTVDQYDLALRLQAAALSAARRDKDTRAIAQLTQRREEIAAARQHYEEVRQSLDAIQAGGSDPKLNLTVGTYLCFVKNQWERGLPLLADGADPRLALLADAELAAPQEPSAKMALADQWWQLAEEHRQHRRACERRAEHWYRLALPGLSDSLLKVRAELRLQELGRK